jgi:hypothetical protein
MEQSGAIQLDGGSGGIEVSGAAMITELANGDERTGGKVRKDVCSAGAGRKAWQVESGGVAGAENATIGYNDGNAGIG